LYYLINRFSLTGTGLSSVVDATSDGENINKNTILALVRFSPSGVVCLELERRMGLNRARVTKFVTNLQTIKINREDGGFIVHRSCPIALLQILLKKGGDSTTNVSQELSNGLNIFPKGILAAGQGPFYLPV
jgi:hypothetical protein